VGTWWAKSAAYVIHILHHCSPTVLRTSCFQAYFCSSGGYLTLLFVLGKLADSGSESSTLHYLFPLLYFPPHKLVQSNKVMSLHEKSQVSSPMIVNRFARRATLYYLSGIVWPDAAVWVSGEGRREVDWSTYERRRGQEHLDVAGQVTLPSRDRTYCTLDSIQQKCVTSCLSPILYDIMSH
jgi:hypothetical protein